MKIVIMAAAMALLGACASSTSTANNGVLNGRAMADKTVKTNEDGEEIICKREKATGSRVRVNEICGTAEQWEQKREANRKGLNDLTGNRAASNSN